MSCLRVGFLASALVAGGATVATAGKRVIVLGFDGFDHAYAVKLIAEGKLPNLANLARDGSFGPLETAVPPQSPVAWSDFITGTDAGGHGIFDFIHRDPATLIPMLSTSKTTGSTKNLTIRKQWKIPLSGGEVELMRHGQPFWEFLEKHGVETTIVRMPANFPPSGTATRELSGMGTPDLLGGYGSFSFYTSNYAPFEGEDVTGGKVYKVVPRDGVVRASIYGPTNPMLVQKQKLRAPFTVYIDAVEPLAKVVIGGEERLLREGEWSDWVEVSFPMLEATVPFTKGETKVPLSSLAGIGRFYLQQVRPEFQLYISPINLDPMNPATPVSHPDDYAAELGHECGRFYTQGMPEDTKALTNGVFNRTEFLAQSNIAGNEIIDQYRVVLSKFEDGLLFYYFGNIDQVSHMLWRTLDRDHPAYDPQDDPRFEKVLEGLYQRLDGVVGHTLERVGSETTLIVMSDHGFTSWRRSFNLNSWLRDNGFLTVKNAQRGKDPGFLRNVDWTRTKAYAYGINGLYLNLKGRERYGAVEPAQRQAVLDDIKEKLLATLDPTTSTPAVTRVYQADTYYTGRGYLDIGPDIIVGYAKGVRGSDKSALGEFTDAIMVDNERDWSGDHCMDHLTVPGVLFSSRPLKKPVVALKDLAAAVVAEFGLEGFPAQPE